MQKPLEAEVVDGDPQHDPDRESVRRSAEALARILDTAIPIPGTSVRIGLDPLIGLLPGIGDALASHIGSAILVMASQLQVPKVVMVRMSLNLLLNGMIGALPVVGDLFSVWFRSNARNAHLLRRHSSATYRPSSGADWVFVFVVIIATLALTLGTILGVLWLVARLWELVN